jgi:hypothetical protein
MEGSHYAADSRDVFIVVQKSLGSFHRNSQFGTQAAL